MGQLVARILHSTRFLLPAASLLAAFLLGATPVAAATMLFESDFGGSVNMSTSPLVYSSCTNGWWQIQGGDDGYTWPININSGSTKGLQFISFGPCVEYNSTTQTIDATDGSGPIWKAEIVQGTRHDGTTGSMLHMQNFQNTLWQLPYVIEPASDVTDYYEKMWIKFPATLAQEMGPNQWRVIAEMKDSGYNDSGCPFPGSRIAVYVYTDANENLSWDMHSDNCPQGPFWWEKTSQAPVPVGQWFSFEWAWHRTHDNTSWTWVKINGTNIMEQDGGDTNPNGFYGLQTSPIDRIMPFQMYQGSGPTEQWVDHIEVWNGVPSSDTAAPSTPTGLVASAVSTSQINLSWSASTDNVGVTGYKIYRNGTQIATGSGTSYSDTNLSAGTSYSYTVQAYDAAGNTSAQSSAVSAQTSQAVSASITTSATSVPGGTPLTATVTNGPADISDWVGLYPLGVPFSYPLGTAWRSMNDTQTEPASGIANAAIHITASTTPGQYEFRLYNGVTIALVATSPTITVTAPDTTAPSTPSSLATIPASDSQINLSWAPSSDNIGVAGYKIFRNGVQVGTSTGTTFSDMSLSPSTVYSYTVQAFDAAGNTSGKPTTVADITSGVASSVGIGSTVVTTANLNVRQSASPSATKLSTETVGSTGTVIGGPSASGGYTWWQIRYTNSFSGWSVGDYLAPITPSAASPTLGIAPSKNQSLLDMLAQAITKLEVAIQQIQAAQTAAAAAAVGH